MQIALTPASHLLEDDPNPDLSLYSDSLDTSDIEITGDRSSTGELATPFVETPSSEFYGFVLYLLSTIFFVAYLVWAYFPETLLHQIGITYYCSRLAYLSSLLFMIIDIGPSLFLCI